jgi:tetratricopeptide (TPR) repeat protein
MARAHRDPGRVELVVREARWLGVLGLGCGSIPVARPFLVSKRNRDKRKRRSLDRTGAPKRATIRSDGRVESILARLANDPPAEGVLEEARGIAADLRHRGKLEAALEVLSRAGRRTPELCLEEALAAFASGDDERALAAAGSDRNVANVMEPLLAAARAAPVPRAPPRATPHLLALHAAAAAVAACQAGERERAKRALARIPKALRAGALYRKLALAIDLELGAEHPPWPALVGLEGGRDLVVLSALARRDPEAVLRRVFELDARARAPAAAAALGALGAGDDTKRLSSTAGELGPEIFSTADRGLAALYQGFGLLSIDPERAERVFRRAIDLGADRTEAVRGLLLAAKHQFEEHRLPERLRIGVKAALDLAARLAPDSGGAPCAFAAAMRAADMSGPLGDRASAARAISLSRSAAVAGAFENDRARSRLETMEAMLALIEQDRARAEASLERAIERDPRNADAWIMRIDLARPDEDEMRALAEKAGEQTRDARIAALVDALKRRALGPGALSNRVGRRLSAGEPIEAIWPDLDPSKLDEGDRAAFAAGVFALVSEMVSEEVGSRFAARLIQTDLDARSRRAIAAVALNYDLDAGPIFEGWAEHALRTVDAGLAMEAIDCSLAGERPDLAERVLAVVHPLLSARELSTAKERIRRCDRPRAPDIGAIVDDVHDRLHPELCITELLEGEGSRALDPLHDLGERPGMEDAREILEMIELLVSPKSLKRMGKRRAKKGADVSDLLAALRAMEERLRP